MIACLHHQRRWRDHPRHSLGGRLDDHVVRRLVQQQDRVAQVEDHRPHCAFLKGAAHTLAHLLMGSVVVEATEGHDQHVLLPCDFDPVPLDDLRHTTPYSVLLHPDNPDPKHRNPGPSSIPRKAAPVTAS